MDWIPLSPPPLSSDPDNPPKFGTCTLLVKSIQDHGGRGSIFKYDGILGGIFPGFMWDPYRVTRELSRDPNVIILAS